jgi:hypothetical protein
MARNETCALILMVDLQVNSGTVGEAGTNGFADDCCYARLLVRFRRVVVIRWSGIAVAFRVGRCIAFYSEFLNGPHLFFKFSRDLVSQRGQVGSSDDPCFQVPGYFCLLVRASKYQRTERPVNSSLNFRSNLIAG